MTVPGQFDEKDHASLSDELTNIEQHWWVFPNWVMVLGFVIAICSAFYFVSFAARLVATLAAILCAREVAYRSGVYFGFARGFRQGHEEGVRRANGPLTPPPP